MGNWGNYKRLKRETLLATTGNWRNYKRMEKDKSVVTMGNWRNNKRLKQWNISGNDE